MSAEYLLSVDLGTSHTVAVVVWPDGRTRPLLFDGSPVMPSAVFLDEAGTIHVGRDAERLGPTAPERFEPNPKQRIGDGALLLGDREIPVTAAFAAILTRVARQCVEAVGGLPRAVLTCPAAWSEQRRSALHDAAAQAGYAPVRIVTEPVAAAYYYTVRLAHPIAPGQALSVFDFGGGTLDIAVVERARDGSFTVLADGGLTDLGGLDFDAALVARIGETVRQRDPELWKRLEQPGSATEMRDRRTLWDDVRGAKEMLSRSSVAPVTVPGLEQALHLTRGELDQLARPLLSRAVAETRRVVGLTGRAPDQLAGLFLVGGSSRMPLVSKALHEELGIAPTVLEQPELPVSEGAAVAVAGPAPLTPQSVASPPAVPAQQTSPASGSMPPTGPSQDATLGLQMPGQGKRRKRKRAKIIAAVAVLALLAVAGPLLWLYFTDPYKQRPFIDIEAVGDPIPYVNEDRVAYYVSVPGGHALFAYAVSGRHTASGEDEVHFQAVDPETGDPLWDGERVLTGEGWSRGTWWTSKNLIAVSESVENGYTWHFFDWATGEELGSADREGGSVNRSGDHLVSAWESGFDIAVYDRTGDEVQRWEVGDEEESVSIASWGVVGAADDLIDPVTTEVGDGRVWAVTSDGLTHVFDIESGDLTESRQVESAEDSYFAYNGKLYVSVQAGGGYSLNVFDIDSGLESVDSERVYTENTFSSVFACGEQRVCITEEFESDELSTAYHYKVYDVDDGEIIGEFDDRPYTGMEVVGDRLLLEYDEDGTRTQVYDDGFDAVGESKDGTFAAIDGGSALSWPEGDLYSTAEGVPVGLGVRDGTRTSLGASIAAYDCAAADTSLACFTEEGMQIYRFRED